MRSRRENRAGQYESSTYRDLQERLSANCLRLRRTNRWTQEDAAHQAHMSTRLFQRIEGCDANLTLTTIARLCEGFGVDVGELLRRPRRAR